MFQKELSSEMNVNENAFRLCFYGCQEFLEEVRVNEA